MKMDTSEMRDASCEVQGGWNVRSTARCTMIGLWLKMNLTFHLLVSLDSEYDVNSRKNTSMLQRIGLMHNAQL